MSSFSESCGVTGEGRGGSTCLNPSHCVPLCVLSVYRSSNAFPSAKSLISCLKLSRWKAGTSGTFKGRLFPEISCPIPETLIPKTRTHFNEIFSPVLISADAAFTLVGVRRLSLPIWLIGQP